MEVNAAIEQVTGFKVAGVHCGLKDNGALDFALIVSDRPCTAAAVFTTNQVKSAHVLVDMEKLKRNSTSIRAVAINSKCANACTGQQGIDNAYETARWIAEKIGCGEDEVLVMSTGVIGTQLPMDKIKRGVELSVAALGENNWEAAARAIMTTDTRPKLASFRSEAWGYTIGGIAKGAGMIAPNMATMLGIVVTDGLINSPGYAKYLLSGAVKSSFNHIVVDGDESTNDTVLFLANRATGQTLADLPSDGYEYEASSQMTSVCEKLARDIVLDAEGATKFITIHVHGELSSEDAHKIANAIATSPLVKTAFYGGDANWGRILAAAGRAGIPLDVNKLDLSIRPEPTRLPERAVKDDTKWTAASVSEFMNGIVLIENGQPTSYDEGRAAQIMREPDIVVELKYGETYVGHATVWTCDLGHDYVSINGHYRT